MSATNEQLKQALTSVWALVYRATQISHLDHEQITKLQVALNVLSEGRENDDYFNRQASYIHDCVRTSGILSFRKATGTEEIMADCERLQRNLE